MQCDNLKGIDKDCTCENFFGLFAIPPEQFTALATLIGFILAKDLDVDEQNSLGNFIIAIGQVLVTIASQKELFESKISRQSVHERLDYLKKNLSALEQELSTV